jgi:hypothetical protein
MSDVLDLITGLTEKQQRNIFTWMGSLEVTMIIDIIQEAVRKTYQLKNERPTLPGREAKYCGIILAARQMGWDTVKGKNYRVAGDKQYEDYDRILQDTVTKMIRNGRPPVLRRKVIAYWGEIKVFRAQGVGFGPISEYLLKKHKLKVSKSYLTKLWEEEETQ